MADVWPVIAVVTAVKLLLLETYRSTDFEVHRNWLAITYSLPINKWYYENTSEWTLDYPPLFAWFEFGLSQLAQFFDADMLRIENLNYASHKTVVFQRLSVIVADAMFIYGIHRCCQVYLKEEVIKSRLYQILFTNACLLMIDHIHFQYNGMLYGILLVSIAYMLEDQFIKSAIAFTALINLKHIYIYLAPAYFCHLLRHYCFNKSEKKPWSQRFSLTNFVKLGSCVVAVFVISFGPFIAHIPQVLSRLFPFKRGLCHAYWAPNIWAIYNLLDKAATMTAHKLFNRTYEKSVMTGGLVQNFSHQTLPNITPGVSFLLTALFMLPVVFKLFRCSERLKKVQFLRAVTLCGFVSFLFGWHVHEKAILMILIPMTITALGFRDDMPPFIILSFTGCYSIFPLLFEPSLLVIKAALTLVYFAILLHTFSSNYVQKIGSLLSIYEWLYLSGFLGLFFYENVIHGFVILKYPFLPLMMTSVYCSLGVVYCWVSFYKNFLLIDVTFRKKTKNR